MSEIRKYLHCRVNGKFMALHRALYIKTYGSPPKGWVVHHINGNSLDNRLMNLRAITKKEHHMIHSGNYIWLRGKVLKGCARCKTFKTVDNFWLYSNVIRRVNKSGTVRIYRKHNYYSYCKQCSVEYTRIWRRRKAV